MTAGVTGLVIAHGLQKVSLTLAFALPQYQPSRVFYLRQT